MRRVRVGNSVPRDISSLLTVCGIGNFDLNVWITTDETMRSLNSQYAGKRKSTDVLSFPAVDSDGAGRLPWDEVALIGLGDIVISAPYVKRWCACPGRPMFEQRMEALIVHGLLHLCGYEHDDDRDWVRMRRTEALALSRWRSSMKNARVKGSWEIEWQG